MSPQNEFPVGPAHKKWKDIRRKRSLRYKLSYWWIRRIRFPLEIALWNRAVRIIHHWDYYVISDHDFYRGVEAGLWTPEDYKRQAKEIL